MRSLRKFALGLASFLAINFISDASKAGFFELPFTPAADQRFLDFSGRLDFKEKNFYRFSEFGDEHAILTNNKVVGICNLINPQSHYADLKVYIDNLSTPEVDGLPIKPNLVYGVDYFIRAYDSKTKKVWDVEEMVGDIKVQGLPKIRDLQLRAYTETNDNINNYSNINQVPEPVTMGLLGLGVLLLGRKRK